MASSLLARVWLLVAAFSVLGGAGCSALLGADFDDTRVRDERAPNGGPGDAAADDERGAPGTGTGHPPLPDGGDVDPAVLPDGRPLVVAPPPPSRIDGATATTCAIRTSGLVVCWGGFGGGADERSAPTDQPMTHVSLGTLHGCGLRTNGTVVCWGATREGAATAPTGTFRDVAAGDTHSCGIRMDGSITCWGASGKGQMNAPPGAFVQVSAGEDFTCALREDGTVACWGEPGYEPPAGLRFSQIDAHFWSVCGVRVSGDIACWGDSMRAFAGPFRQARVWSGLLYAVKGDGTVVRLLESSPPTVTLEGAFHQVAIGSDHGCAIRLDGAVVCWGDDDHGQRSGTPTGTFW